MKKASQAGRLLALGVALAGATLLVPALALAALTGTARATAGTATPPRCGNAHPAFPGGAFIWPARPGNGSAGHIDYEVEVSNVGTHRCTLRGVPGLAAVLANGHIVGGKVAASGNGPLVTLQPDATAHFLLTIVDGGALCAHPEASAVVVYLPGQRQGQDTNLSAEACPGHRGGGVLSAVAIRSGTGIPLYDN